MSSVSSGVRGRLRFRLLCVLVIASFATPSWSIGEEILKVPFEDESLCDWSALLTDCLTETAIDQRLEGITIQFCVPPNLNPEWCANTSCGGEPGCPATAQVVQSTSDFSISSFLAIDLELTIDDLDIPFTTATGDCTMQLRDLVASAPMRATPVDCFSPYRFATLVAYPALPIVDSTATATGGFLCQTDEVSIGLAMGQSIAEGLLFAFPAALDPELEGQLLCQPSG